jgi:hypothetical protein
VTSIEIRALNEKQGERVRVPYPLLLKRKALVCGRNCYCVLWKSGAFWTTWGHHWSILTVVRVTWKVPVVIPAHHWTSTSQWAKVTWAGVQQALTSANPCVSIPNEQGKHSSPEPESPQTPADFLKDQCVLALSLALISLSLSVSISVPRLASKLWAQVTLLPQRAI